MLDYIANMPANIYSLNWNKSSVKHTDVYVKFWRVSFTGAYATRSVPSGADARLSRAPGSSRALKRAPPVPLAHPLTCRFKKIREASHFGEMWAKPNILHAGDRYAATLLRIRRTIARTDSLNTFQFLLVSAGREGRRKLFSGLIIIYHWRPRKLQQRWEKPQSSRKLINARLIMIRINNESILAVYM